MRARLSLLPAVLGCLAAATPPPHYVADPAKSTLEFSFTQAGAANHGRFTRFPVSFDFDPDALASAHLEVTVELASLDTGDPERDDTLKGSDFFAVSKYPQAHYSATQFSKTASGYAAHGKLTLRGVTRELTVPFSFRTATEQGARVGTMDGKLTLRRLDYGVGQGDWQATDQVGNEVGIRFALRLVAH